MLITRETDYALRILRELSCGDHLTVGEICRRQMISQQFAYKILRKLKGADLISVTRGADGGCRLAADLRQFSLYDLFVIMEGDSRVSACMEPGFQCAWRKENHSSCAVHRQLALIQRILDESLRSFSLHRLLNDPD